MDELLRKLRYTGQQRVLVLDAPDEFRAVIQALAEQGAAVDMKAEGAYPWALVFVKSVAETAEIARRVTSLMDGDALLWLAYPKQTSRRYSVDINRDRAWALFEDTEARLVAQTALDDDWSAMRVRKREFVK